MKISIKRDILWNIQSFSSMNAYDNMHNEIFFKIVNDLDDKLNVSLNEIERRLRTPLFQYLIDNKNRNKPTLYVVMSKNTKSLKLFICQLSMDKGSCRLFTILNHNEKFRIVLYTPSCTELYDKLINGTYLPTKMELEFTKNEKTNH